jgi:hypothetical protein
MWRFEVNDMCDPWHVDSRPRSGSSHNIWCFTTEPRLETILSLGKEMSVAILGVSMIIDYKKK